MIRTRHVSLIEGRFPHITMRVVPIAVADRLKATVWDRTATVIAVSATRQTGGSFECWMGRVGAPRDTATMAMPSPCNFRARARLYVPRPPEAFVPVAPTQQAYGRDTEAMVGTMIGLLHARQARALVLCTSDRAMQVWGGAGSRQPFPIGRWSRVMTRGRCCWTSFVRTLIPGYSPRAASGKASM